MKKITSFVIIIACLFLTASRPALRPVFTGGDYRIYAEKNDKNAEYKVNDFYSVYYVYMNVIRALDVNDRLGGRDIENIISLIIDNLKKRNVVQLQVDNYKGSEGTLRVTLRSDIAPDDKKPALWIISNYNANTKKVVSGDDQKDAYATFFYLAGDKLVKYQYVSEPKSEAELKRGSVNKRADYYLLDRDPGNDGHGRDLVTKEIEKTGDMPDRAVLYMTLSEYDLLSGKAGSAKQSLDKARAIIGSLKDEKRRSALSNVLQYADDLYKYYVKYTGRS
jgi:hypothetical protein